MHGDDDMRCKSGGRGGALQGAACSVQQQPHPLPSPSSPRPGAPPRPGLAPCASLLCMPYSPASGWMRLYRAVSRRT